MGKEEGRKEGRKEVGRKKEGRKRVGRKEGREVERREGRKICYSWCGQRLSEQKNMTHRTNREKNLICRRGENEFQKVFLSLWTESPHIVHKFKLLKSELYCEDSQVIMTSYMQYKYVRT